MELLKKMLALWVETRWLKTIDKEQRKLERMQNAAKEQRHVVIRLTEEYFKRYPHKEVQE